MRLRPPVRAVRPSLQVERRLSRIPPAAVDRLLRLAERQSEGALDRSRSPARYCGSTYFTFPLPLVQATFAGAAVGRMTADELGRKLADHPLLRLRMLRFAREEAERRIEAGDGRGRGLVPETASVASVISPREEEVVIEVAMEIDCLACGDGGT
jgi:hypothetical protein